MTALSFLQQNQATALPRFETIVDLGPEGPEIINGGYYCEQNNKVERDDPERPKNRIRVATRHRHSENQQGDGGYLRDHLHLAEFRSIDRKTLGGCDAAQTCYREFPAYGGQQSVRIGDWKGIRQNLNPPGQQKKPELRTELYNLNEDEAEQRDVSAANPQMVARIECIMREQHTKSGLFPFPALDE